MADTYGAMPVGYCALRELYRPGLVAGTREIVVHPNYVVIYRVTISAIEIINVLHSRQQYP